MMANRLLVFFIVMVCLLIGLVWLTVRDMPSLPVSFADVLAKADRVQLLDRHGEPLSVTYRNRWNVHDRVALHDIPFFLQRSFIAAEDQRFYQHHGVDWLARLHALQQNLVHGAMLRGASTLSEQVLRMLLPRPRTLWSKWLEGWQAMALERRFGKRAILEFYLNQAPYAANRRGIVQAARYYFDRDLQTLSHREMLALAVLVRAPSRLDSFRYPDAMRTGIDQLAERLLDSTALSSAQYRALREETLQLRKPALPIHAGHFLRHVLAQVLPRRQRITTTLDGALQAELQGILDQRLRFLRQRAVHNGALLVVDHGTGEVLAWVVAGAAAADWPGAKIDAVTTRRQPGSALKPLLYALALRKGWTAATVLDDAPLQEAVGDGLHRYHNYSRVHYGQVSVREALANSLNIPALKTIQFVGVTDYLDLLRALGFAGLTRHPDYYGDGLALGNAGVSLLELVRAYAVLANRGVFQELKVVREEASASLKKRIFSPEVSSLIGNILADGNARHLEFGTGTVLHMPRQPAVKTGTSSDFRDSWTLAYNDRFVVGIWMGNLDNSETDGITGAAGPGLVMRSVFSVLNRGRPGRPLYLSAKLISRQVCQASPAGRDADATCAIRKSEYFIPGTVAQTAIAATVQQPAMRITQPSPGLQLAVDPRVPLAKQAFAFQLQGVGNDAWVSWLVDGRLQGVGPGGRRLWPLQRGGHRLRVVVGQDGETAAQTFSVDFTVK